MIHKGAHKSLTPITFRSADVDGITITGTLDDSIDFASVFLTKDELALRVETGPNEARKCNIALIMHPALVHPNFVRGKPGITKSFKSEAIVQTLDSELSFAIIHIPRRKITSEDDIHNNLPHTGTL